MFRSMMTMTGSLNLGHGITPWGTAIIPSYNSLFDDPRRHALYLDRRILAWLRAWPAVPDVLKPVGIRAIQAGFTDGFSLLPLGVYWHHRVNAQTFQMWSMASCFDFIPVERLTKPDDQLRAYMHCLQMDSRKDDRDALKDYVKLRHEPDYWTAHCYKRPVTALPIYMIDVDGDLVISHGPYAPVADDSEWDFL